MSDEKDLHKRLNDLGRSSPEAREAHEADLAEIRRRVRQRLTKESGRPAKPILYSRDVPRTEPRPRRPRPPQGKPICLEDAVEGVEVTVPGRGRAYVVTSTLADLEDDWGPLCQAFRNVMDGGDGRLDRWLAEMCDPQAVGPGDALIVDIETTGLSTSPLFLIGAMNWEAGDFVVRQYLARDYAEEAAAISLFLDQAADSGLVVSFNGKSYDLPYIRMRAVATGLPCDLDPRHLDLLHVSRRIWRGVLPDCRLQTLERFVCGRSRSGDIPGAQIPDAYHEFVRTRNAVQLVNILNHNLLDLVTLADLMTRLPAPRGGDET